MQLSFLAVVKLENIIKSITFSGGLRVPRNHSQEHKGTWETAREEL